jgi:hypothetical protein
MNLRSNKTLLLCLFLISFSLSAKAQVLLECMKPNGAQNSGQVVVDSNTPGEQAKMRLAPSPVTRASKHILVVHWQKGVHRFADVAPYMIGEIAGRSWTYCGYSAEIGVHAVQKNDEKINSGVLIDQKTGLILPGGFSVSFSPDRTKYIAYEQVDGSDFSNLKLYRRDGTLIWSGYDGLLGTGNEEMSPEFDRVYWKSSGDLMAEYLLENKKILLMLKKNAQGKWDWQRTDK